MLKLYFFAEGDKIEELREYLERELVGDCYSSLKRAKEAIASDLSFKSSEFVAAVFCEGDIYALVAGGASLWLNRHGHRVALLKTLQETSSIISGHVEDGDLFEVETSIANYSFSKEEQRSLGEGLVPQEGSQKLNHKAAGLIDRVLSKLPERKIIINGDERKTPRATKASLIGVGLLVLLGISIYFGMGRRQEKIARQEYEPTLMAAIHDYNESLELVGLSKARARELILSSRNKANGLAANGIKDERLLKLQDDISNNLAEIAGIYDNKAEVFLDLSIIASGFQASDLAFSEGVLRVLDSSGRRLVGVEVSNKRTNVISGPDYLPDAISTAAYADRSFILSSDGIRETTDDVELVIKPDGWDPKNSLFFVFAGNVYVLDRNNDQIWRYQGVRGGFLEKEAWLGEGFTRDTSQAVFMAIDGSIWTVSQDGEFSVYSLGAPARFAVANETSAFSKVAGFYTDEQSKFLYVLDSGNSRISIIKKDGEYLSEYIAPELSSATDVVVDEPNGLILFLANGKLYMIKAKHLDNFNESTQQES